MNDLTHLKALWTLRMRYTRQNALLFRTLSLLLTVLMIMILWSRHSELTCFSSDTKNSLKGLLQLEWKSHLFTKLYWGKMGVNLNAVLNFLLEHIHDYYIKVSFKHWMQSYVVLSRCELWWLQLVLGGTCLRFCLHLSCLALMEESCISSYTETIPVLLLSSLFS